MLLIGSSSWAENPARWSWIKLEVVGPTDHEFLTIWITWHDIGLRSRNFDRVVLLEHSEFDGIASYVRNADCQEGIARGSALHYGSLNVSRSFNGSTEQLCLLPQARACVFLAGLLHSVIHSDRKEAMKPVNQLARQLNCEFL
jgi:hypothetical protein